MAPFSVNMRRTELCSVRGRFRSGVGLGLDRQEAPSGPYLSASHIDAKGCHVRSMSTKCQKCQYMTPKDVNALSIPMLPYPKHW